MPGFAAIPFLAACLALSAAGTWLSIRYAHRRAMFDLPGQRRSHMVPTPRGGGIGIVVAVLSGLAVCAVAGYMRTLSVPAIAAVSLVAVTGWIDDHRALGVRIRLLSHLIAVFVLYFALFEFLVVLASSGFQLTGFGHPDPDPPAARIYVLLALIAGFVLVNIWFINLHNFMDGINGLLASQALFVFAALAALLRGENALLPMLCAAAVAGFLPFNFPRARVFMGDVGSGALGLLIAGAVTLQAISFNGSAFSGLIGCSAFVTDATCTLLSRMLRGRRWYSAHREHLYQWLVRSGFSHARVVAFYMGWNLFVVVPVLYAVNRGGMAQSPFAGFAWMLAVYALAVAIWIAGKRWCLQHAKNTDKRKA